MLLTIEGAPRTAKNHLRRIKRGNRIFSVGSAAHKLWEDKAIWQLRDQWRGKRPIAGPVEVTALVYRKTNVGDLVGFLQAVGDSLEKAKVLENDKWIASWAGSRLLKDAARPRVEIEIVEVPL